MTVLGANYEVLKTSGLNHKEKENDRTEIISPDKHHLLQIDQVPDTISAFLCELRIPESSLPDLVKK